MPGRFFVLKALAEEQHLVFDSIFPVSPAVYSCPHLVFEGKCRVRGCKQQNRCNNQISLDIQDLDVFLYSDGVMP